MKKSQKETHKAVVVVGLCSERREGGAGGGECVCEAKKAIGWLFGHVQAQKWLGWVLGKKIIQYLNAI